MRHTSLHLRLISFLLVILLIGYSSLAFVRTDALPVTPTETISSTLPATTASPLSWPGYGQAAVGAEGYGLLAANGAQTPVPTASTAKIMTAYAVLKMKPLNLGQQTTPTLTMTQSDVDILNNFISEDGSVVAVTNGEQMSEYQALEALLLPSANNIADSIVNWAFGSTANYLAYANDLANQLGLTDTHFDDASGFSPQTVSTAQDMVRLALVAMKDPVLAQIVSQPTANLPLVGQVRNVNSLLGTDNIIGIKTGNTDQAGGCFVGAATHTINGKSVTVISAIMAAPDLGRSLADSQPLLASAEANFANIPITPKGTTIGYYKAKWFSRNVSVQTAQDVSLLVWKGSQPQVDVGIKTVTAPLKANTNVGTLYVHTTGANMSTALKTSSALPGPSWWWRLRHPF